MILVLGDLLCAVDFCGAGLFFVLGLRLISMLIVIFKGYLLAPPDNIIVSYIVDIYNSQNSQSSASFFVYYVYSGHILFMI